jgi:hypothetical protein
MEQLLLQLLEALEAIGQQYEEISDTESRAAIRKAIHHGFLKPDADYSLPTDFGLSDEEGNNRVRNAVGQYIQAAKLKAGELGLNFHQRLDALQNHLVATADGSTSDEFAGYTSRSMYTESGDWLGGS